MQKTPQEKYQPKPYLGSSHYWAFEKCKDIAKDAKVLDIGPGSGIMGQHLLSREVTNLTAVEIDPDARKHVAPHYKLVLEDISSLKEEKYDLILLLDVLEHMTNSFDYLKTISTLLKPNGKILISLPNVAHWSVRIPLLFGFFHYTDRGILDRTHFQFFTRNRVKSLIGYSETLKATEYSSSIEPIQFLLPKWAWNNQIFTAISKVRLSLSKAIPGLFAYQHLTELKHRHE